MHNHIPFESEKLAPNFMSERLDLSLIVFLKVVFYCHSMVSLKICRFKNPILKYFCTHLSIGKIISALDIYSQYFLLLIFSFIKQALDFFFTLMVVTSEAHHTCTRVGFGLRLIIATLNYFCNFCCSISVQLLGN